MEPWWESPLAGFDTETTGVDPDTARVVQVYIDGEVTLVDPGVEIPPEAAAIHGISTDRAREEGVPEAVIAGLLWEKVVDLTDRGVPIVAFNAAYDFTVADRMFRRHGLRLPHGTFVIDPFVLDKEADRYRRGSRSLAATATQYGLSLENAHDASADAVMAVEIARALGRTGRFDPDPYVLYQQQLRWRWAQVQSLEEHFRKNDPDVVLDRHWPVHPVPTGG